MSQAVPQRSGGDLSHANFLLLVGLTALVAGGKAILFDTLHPDCFWHLRVAEQLGNEGIGPLVDWMSFASSESAWSSAPWLAELGMKAVWDRGGYRAAIVTQAALQAGFALAVAFACRAARPAVSPRSRFLLTARRRRASGDAALLPAAVTAAGVTFVSLPYLGFQPMTAALVLLAICVGLLVRDRAAGERTRAVWGIVPLAALMTNLHPIALLIPASVAALLLGAAWERWCVAEHAEQPDAGRRAGRYFALSVAASLACLATPMLPGMVEAAQHAVGADVMSAAGRLAEARPFSGGSTGRISAALVAAGLLATAVNRRRLRAGDWVWLLAVIALAAQAGRFAPVLALIAGPMVAVTLPRLGGVILAPRAVAAALSLTLVGGVVQVVSAFPRGAHPMERWVNRRGIASAGYPCEAAAFVASHVQPKHGRVISEFGWGGYLEWRLGERFQLLADGRTQLFPAEFWQATYLAPPEVQQNFLSQLDADVAVLPVRGSLLRHALIGLGWETRYRDERAEVLVPPPPKPAANGERWTLVSLLGK